MVRPQQASAAAADAGGGSDSSDTPAPPASPLNGECRPAEAPPPLPLGMPPPPPPDGLRYTPSPHSQDSASPPQAAASPHVVLLHIVDGESIHLQRGDSVELIQGEYKQSQCRVGSD